jgi:hypothetical protein
MYSAKQPLIRHAKPEVTSQIQSFEPLSVAIIAVGILFIIWQNIGKCERDHSSSSTTCLGTGGDGAHSNLVIHADCHAANKGLFAGLIVLVASIVSIILFCIVMADKYVVTVVFFP